MRALLLALLSIGSLPGALITLGPGESLGALLTVTPGDYLGLPPAPDGMFDDLFMMARDNLGVPPLAICCAQVHLFDVGWPNVYGYAAHVLRAPAQYHLDIANVGSVPYSFDLGKLVENPEPGTWALIGASLIAIGWARRKRAG